VRIYVTYMKVLPAMLSFLTLFAFGLLYRRGDRGDRISPKGLPSQALRALLIAFLFKPLLEVGKGR